MCLQQAQQHIIFFPPLDSPAYLCNDTKSALGCHRRCVDGTWMEGGVQAAGSHTVT